MTELRRLRREALRAARSRGHASMRWDGPAHELTQRQTAICLACGAWVQVDTRPAPNGINVAGSAVATNCTRQAAPVRFAS